MRQSKPIRIVGLLAAAALLVSCAGISSLEKQDTVEAAHFNNYAGKPVNHFRWLTQHRGTAAISANQLVAWADFMRPYLITVTQPCPDLMLNYRGITSTLDQVCARSNRVAVSGRFCDIQSIRPVDYARMERDLRRNLAGASRKAQASHLRG
ncbi:MAG: hypothetical protein KGO22_15240 [Gammaproteobacteria bacterium]|nr:hypothetical protein [Gammaproteobacteria bacterium]